MNPPADPPPGDPNTVPPPKKSGGIECGFCECTIATGDGGVIKTSERSRKLARATETIGELTAEIERLKARIVELTPAPAPAADKKKSGGLSIFAK